MIAPLAGVARTRFGIGSRSSSSRIRGGSLPPPDDSAAALRRESSFAGGLCGRDRLALTLRTSPATVKARSLAMRAGRAGGVPRYARGVARFEHVPPGERTPDPRPGDFILTHGGELFSRLIQIGQQLRYAGTDQPYTYWNHTALIVSNDGALVEALGAGVHRTTLAAYDQTQYTVVAIDASAEDRAEMVAFAEHWIGARYDWATIVSIGLSLLTGAKFSFGFAGQLICSGLVARALERTATIFEDEPSHVMPAGLAKMFGVTPPSANAPKGRAARRG